MRIKEVNPLKVVADTSPFRNLLMQRLDSKITMLEFEVELACGSIPYFDVMQYVSPEHPPAIYAEYEARFRNSDDLFKKKKVQERVCAIPKVQEYFQGYVTTMYRNRSRAEEIEQNIVALLCVGDNINADRYHDIYYGYPSEIKGLDYGLVWYKKSGPWWQMAIKEKMEEDRNEREERNRKGKVRGSIVDGSVPVVGAVKG